MKHLSWKKLSYLVYGFLFVLLFYLLAEVELRYGNPAIYKYDYYYPLLHIITATLFSLLGFLATKQWFLYIMSKYKSIHIKLLLLGISLLAIGFIPLTYWLIWLGLHTNFLFTIMLSTYVSHAISMLAGVVIGKSFTNKAQS